MKAEKMIILIFSQFFQYYFFLIFLPFSIHLSNYRINYKSILYLFLFN